MNRIRVLCFVALAAIVLFSVGAGRAVAASVTTVINSNPADGSVYRGNPGGNGSSTGNPQIVGHATGGNYNGVTFYALPDPGAGIGSASLDFLITQGGAIPAAIDLWGLGYIHGSPALVPNWELHADTDVTLWLNGAAPTKIADDFFAANATLTASAHWVTNPAQSAALVSYLNSLYTAGAVAGDYVVFRTNPDANVGDLTGNNTGKNVRFGTDVNAKLTITTVPEPTTLGLLAVASLAMIRRRI